MTTLVTTPPRGAKISPAQRARAVNVHLYRGCRYRKWATSTDPRAINCPICLGSRRWRALAKRTIKSER